MKMLRRDFLKLLSATPLMSLLGLKQDFIHPVFGKYVSHFAENSSEYMCPPDSPGIRYVRFPIESTLTVVFEKYEVKYVGFNASVKLIDKTNNMLPNELFRYEVGTNWQNSSIELIDRYVGFDDKNIKKRDLPKTIKFRISSVWYKDESTPSLELV